MGKRQEMMNYKLKIMGSREAISVRSPRHEMKGKKEKKEAKKEAKTSTGGVADDMPKIGAKTSAGLKLQTDVGGPDIMDIQKVVKRNGDDPWQDKQS